MDKPPPLPSMPSSSASSFPRQAATFSLLAPFVAMGISIVVQPQVRGNRLAMIILGLTSVLLIVLGLVFGVVALVATKRHGREGIFGKAIAGTCMCGLLTLLMLISIPGLMRAMERSKEMHRQKLQQESTDQQ